MTARASDNAEIQNYVIPKEAWNILTTAKKESVPVFIFGMSGYGKTSLIRNFFKNKNYYYCDENTTLKEYLKISTGKRKTPIPVVFDDIQLVADEKIREQILILTERSDLWPIYISRALYLSWLRPSYAARKYVIIRENMLALSDAQARDFLEARDLHFSTEQVKKLQSFIQGNPFALTAAASRLQQEPDTKKLAPFLQEIFAGKMQQEIKKHWDQDFKTFFLIMSTPNSFTPELAEKLSGSPFVMAYLEKARNTGSFLVKENDHYFIRPIPLAALRHQANITFGSAKIKELALHSAQWYEQNDDFENAMALYLKAERKDCVIDLLIQNAAQNPSNGHYLGLSKYYFELSEKEIEQNIVLMSGMCMVCSMTFKTEQSEYWYEKIKERARTAKGKEKTEAKRRLAYLDIALPHRGSKNILSIIKDLSTLIITKGMKLPAFSITSNLPSTMNGGKDFSDWSLKDKEIMTKYGALIALAAGEDGKGLLNLAMGESQYEKGGTTSDILPFLSRGQLETELSGNIDMTFVSTALLIRFYLINGQYETALLQYTAFEKKCKEKKAVKLLPNLYALRCRIDLLLGDTSSVNVWLTEYAPDENKEIFALLRFQYLTKIRCYLQQGKLTEAFSLNEKMKWYAEHYHRTYISIECKILDAIISYRNNESETWKLYLTDALELGSKYHFIRLFSEEGNSLLPLLKKMRDELTKDPNIDRRYLLQLINETERMASIYRTYGVAVFTSRTAFSDTARNILRYQTEGLSVNEIAERLAIKPETIRYHIKQNYKKLGVKTKSQAVIAAREQHLI
ncbi:MAG: hypothetical protein IJS09_00515 [Treponema sp.]|nr:hypothetical protein [Treponema sp.]